MKISIENLGPEDAESVKELEIDSRLSSWPLEDYRSESSRPDSIALIARKKREVIGFVVSRLIMTGPYVPLTVNSYNSQSTPNAQYIHNQNQLKHSLRAGKFSEDIKNSLTETKNENELEIYNIAVARAYRRKNVGAQMIEALIERALRKDVGRIFLEVRRSNVKAVSFYEKHRFVNVGIRREFYRDPVEDALLMRRELST